MIEHEQVNSKYLTPIFIEALRQNGNLTRDDLSKKVGVSDNAVKQHLANLKKENIIKRVGSTKSGYWEFLDG